MISMKLQNKNKKCPRISSEAFTSLIQPVELIKPIQPIELLIVLGNGIEPSLALLRTGF